MKLILISAHKYYVMNGNTQSYTSICTYKIDDNDKYETILYEYIFFRRTCDIYFQFQHRKKTKL